MNNPISSNTQTLSQEYNFDQTAVSIGSHSDNDIVLTGSGVLPFHATVVLEANQYRLIPSEIGSEIRIDGVLVRDSHIRLDTSQQVEIGTHTLFFQDHYGNPVPL